MSQFEDAFRELVQEAIKDQAVSVNADDVEGLEDFVREAVGNEFDSVDKIDGLQDFVKEEVESCIKDSLPDAVNEELDDIIDEKILTALKDHDDIRQVVTDIVKNTIKNILVQLVMTPTDDATKIAPGILS